MAIRIQAPPKYFLCPTCAAANPEPLERHSEALRPDMHCVRCRGVEPAYWVAKGDVDDSVTDEKVKEESNRAII